MTLLAHGYEFLFHPFEFCLRILIFYLIILTFVTHNHNFPSRLLSLWRKQDSIWIGAAAKFLMFLILEKKNNALIEKETNALA